MIEGWYDLEGVFGNKYRWIGARAVALVEASESRAAASAHPLPRVAGRRSRRGSRDRERCAVSGTWKLDRTGLFILEADLPDAPEYVIEIQASPVWQVPTDDRSFTVNVSMIRLEQYEKLDEKVGLQNKTYC